MAEPAAGYGAGDESDEEELALDDEEGPTEHLFDWGLLNEEELAADGADAARHLHVAAYKYRAAAKRARAAGDEEVAARRLATAQDYLAMVNRIVPNCIETSILLANVLFLASKDDEAKSEVLRAIGIPNPIVSSGLPIMSSGDPFVRKTEDQRAENCTQRARISLRVTLDWICSNRPRATDAVWKVLQGYWNSMTSEKRGSFLSVSLDELHKYYDEVYQDDHWAASTISDALSFVKQTGSWRFWICPYCIGEKLPDALSLLGHMRSEHPAEEDLLEVWSRPELNEDASVDDDSLDEITVSQDSEDHYFFHFNEIDRIFQNLDFLPNRISITEEKSFVKTRDEKCEEGTKRLQEMNQKWKKNLHNTDNSSAEACFKFPDLWYDFLANSTLDYRVAVLPLAKSFLWAELIKSMIEDNAEPDTEMVSPNVYAPGSIAIGEHI
ncbi:uncharacterized protein LOC112268642 [Brachypodium distachyon]|uniref:uncharacterized protein LOC112268642 n=1 Tax=Brachypodium distachyon TaxID=15368 RepID=UPI000D0CF6A6|nr:uncharacterized protein LOC112268642 [Brachypodium distachyon]|eukprot:XP_024310321.1 uncharacterized protein LOC112268642 [Brachypodium distachyon]